MRIWHGNRKYANHPSTTHLPCFCQASPCPPQMRRQAGTALQGRTWPPPVTRLLPQSPWKEEQTACVIPSACQGTCPVPGVLCTHHGCVEGSVEVFLLPIKALQAVTSIGQLVLHNVSSSGQLATQGWGRTIPTAAPLMSASTHTHLKPSVITTFHPGMVSRNHLAHSPSSHLSSCNPPLPSVYPNFQKPSLVSEVCMLHLYTEIDCT